MSPDPSGSEDRIACLGRPYGPLSKDVCVGQRLSKHCLFPGATASAPRPPRLQPYRGGVETPPCVHLESTMRRWLNHPEQDSFAAFIAIALPLLPIEWA